MYSWGHLVVPYTEELISRPFLDENSIWQLFWDRVDPWPATVCLFSRPLSLLYWISMICQVPGGWQGIFRWPIMNAKSKWIKFDSRDVDQNCNDFMMRTWMVWWSRMTSRCSTSTWCTSSPCRSTSSWRRWRRMTLPMRLENIIENDQIHLTWCSTKWGLFDYRDIIGLEVLDDFKMLNINMVHVITMY